MDKNIDYNEMSFKDIYEYNHQEDTGEGDTPSSSISEEDAVSMGILHPDEKEEPTPQQTDDGNDNKTYEKLGFWESQADMAKSVGTEALKILAPKKGGLTDKAITKVFGDNVWNEENLWHHEAQTHYAENMRNTYKWVVGIGACLAIPEMGAARLATTAPKLASFISKAFGTGKWIKTSATGGLKLQGVKAANAALTGLVGSEVAEFFLRRPEENEGQFADIFGVSSNPLITALQSDPTDTYWEDKWKAVANGLVVGAVGGIAVERIAIPLAKELGHLAGGIKKWANAKNNKEAMEHFKDVLNSKNNLESITDTASLYNQVKELRDQALTTGEDIDDLLLKQFSNDTIDEARAFNKLLETEHEPYIREDGTWDLAVSKYDEAHLVSEESYIEQRGANGLIKDMDATVKDTWTNRDGLIGTGKTALTKEDGTVNLPVAKKVVNHYKDSWGLDNKINVEVVENLKDPSGKAVQGRTELAKTQGKITKSKQNAIDKKALQVQKLQDKVTMLEGGNEPVMDALDAAKEELRIAQNELQELQKPVINKNITIKIDANCKNPHAVLRSELEHARDYAVGNKTGAKGEKHSFPRYGDVETEDALAAKYVRKKSEGKARALQNDMNGGQTPSNKLKYNQETFNGQQRTNTTTTNTGRLAANGSSDRTSIEGLSQSYEGRSYNGSKGWLVETTHSLPDDVKAELKTQGIDAPDFHQLQSGNDEMAGVFYNALKKAKDLDPKGMASVDLHNPEEYKNMKMFLSDNEDCGFVIKPDGDLISVFPYPKGSGRNKALMPLAIAQGAKKLDCYDTYLPKLYENFGFKEVRRDVWNEKYKPKDWDKDYFKQFNNGEPDVVYMELKNENIKPTGEPQQLKIDFNATSKDVLEGVKAGTIKISSKEDVGVLVDKIAPDIKGYTWKDIANGTDEYCSLLNAVIKNNKDLKKVVQAIAVDGDVKTLDQFTVKGLALTRVLGSLLDKVNINAIKMSTANKDALLSSIDHINAYLDSMGSAKGRALQAQGLIKMGRRTFGTKGLSAMTQEGIHSFSEMLAKAIDDVAGMNFTTSEALAEVTNKLMKSGDDNCLAIINSISRKKQWMAKYRETVERGYKDRLSIEEITQNVSEMLTEERLNEVLRFASLAPDKAGKFEAITKNGVSYYITNLLSGTATVFKNAFSGALNSGIFPAYKIMASGLGAGEDAKFLAAEGWNTYKSMWKSMKEASGLAWKAFLDGEGKFSNIKTLSEDTANTFNLEMTNLLDENNSFLENFWNFYSIMSRAMMASDEFVQQMNYRAISRAKATVQCEELMRNGLLKEADFDDMVEDLLKSQYYYENGMAKDMDILWETRQMTYQNNLDGTVTDPKTGEKYQMRTPSQLMKIAGDINNAVNQNAVLKGAFPFMRTATNIVQQQLDSNGLYATGKWAAERLNETGFIGFFKKETLDSLMEQSPEAAMARARVAMGTMSLMTGMSMAACGFITGSPSIDKNEREAAYKTGWKPYSILIGGQYYSYQGIEPIQGWLAFSADVFNMLSLTSQDDTDAQEVMMKACGMGYAALVDSFINKASFKTGINQLNSLVENPMEYIQSVGKGLLPLNGLVTNISSVGNRYGTKPSSPAQVITNKWFNRGKGDYRRDVFGNRQDLCGLLLIGDKAPNLYKENPEYRELYRLMKDGFNPKEVSKTIAEGKVKYTDFRNPETNRTAYDYMLEEMSSLTIGGKTLQMAVKELISTDYYKEAEDEAEEGEESKRTLLNDIFKEYAFEAEDRIKQKGYMFTHKKTGQTLDVVEDEEALKILQQSSQQKLNDNITNQILKYGQ